jgi:hypothetical protein
MREIRRTMSEENVERVRRSFEAFAEWDRQVEWRGGGLPLRGGPVFTFRNGKVNRVQWFDERDDAHKATGLRE